MTALERRCELFSPAEGGREKPLGTFALALSEGASTELSEGSVIRARQSATALARLETAPDGGFRRGMTLRCDGKRWRVLSAAKHRRVWSLRLERVVMDGEA